MLNWHCHLLCRDFLFFHFLVSLFKIMFIDGFVIFFIFSLCLVCLFVFFGGGSPFFFFFFFFLFKFKFCFLYNAFFLFYFFSPFCLFCYNIYKYCSLFLPLYSLFLSLSSPHFLSISLYPTSSLISSPFP